MLSTSAIRMTAVTVPGVSPDVLPWNKYTVPPVLYKYFPPERFHVLTDCLVRFSQRQVFEDQYDLRPEIATYGTAEEIRTFMKLDPVLRRHPPPLPDAVAEWVLADSQRERAFIQLVQAGITVIDEIGVFCLTEDPKSDRMWNDYADQGRGFVVAFDTTVPEFRLLRSPGGLGKVEYTDNPVSSLLSGYGIEALFRKLPKYEFEAEWRSIRLFSRFPSRYIVCSDGMPKIYLAPFDPKCIPEIFIRAKCELEWELRHLAAIDARYRHVTITSS